MRLVVAAVGRLKQGAERELAERFRERAEKSGRALGFRAVSIVEIEESRARRAEDRMAEEAGALAAAVAPDGAMVALDEHGEAISSAALAERITRWRDSGRPTATFLIGGADGLGGELKRRAELR